MNYYRNSSWKRSNVLIWIALLFVIPLWGLAMTGVQAQDISIGLYDDINTLYLSANQSYKVTEDLDDNDSFTNPRTILESNKEALIRSSPAAANSLLIAAAPDLATTSHITRLTCVAPSLQVLAKPFSPCLFKIKHGNLTRTYRGSIVIKPYKNHFTVINRLDIEDYLKGVVPAEMPSSWHPEALKVQAVAARTYSLSMLGRRKTLGYDLKSSVEDQVYLGYNKEKASTNNAIKLTNGEFLIDGQGLLVEAYFSSTSGRYSASPEEGWGISEKSYLVPKYDLARSWKLEARSRWIAKFSNEQLNDKLSDLRLDSIDAITVINRSMEGRVTSILISSNEKSVLLTGEEFRHQLGLRSTDFQIEYQSNGIILNGYGFGHGIGMSQYGAKYLAEQGKSYQEILGHYYSNARLVSP